MLQAFLVFAVLFTIVLYIIFVLRFLNKLDHWKSGPINKIVNIILST